jgi:hypothetical protein
VRRTGRTQHRCCGIARRVDRIAGVTSAQSLREALLGIGEHGEQQLLAIAKCR